MDRKAYGLVTFDHLRLLDTSQTRPRPPSGQVPQDSIYWEAKLRCEDMELEPTWSCLVGDFVFAIKIWPDHLAFRWWNSLGLMTFNVFYDGIQLWYTYLIERERQSRRVVSRSGSTNHPWTWSTAYDIVFCAMFICLNSQSFYYGSQWFSTNEPQRLQSIIHPLILYWGL